MFSTLRAMIQQRRNRKNLYSTAEYWDFKAATYDAAAVSMWPNQSLNRLYDEEQRRMIGQHMGAVAGLELLDVGCGTGRLSRWLAKQGARVTGVDFSQGALEIARKQSQGDNPQYRQGSVFELTEEQAYDLAFTWGVLTIACRDRAQLLDALTRIRHALRPNGRLFLMEPIHHGFLHRVLKLDLTDFLAVMRSAGFQVHTTAPMHFWPMRLVLGYLPWPEWITAPLYHLGQVAMRLPSLANLGDYHMIVARPAEPLGAANSSVQ
jgi:2-polyprenyl-3-methyl-5-hydroxy-6-metoxy-1,4-benzoquinol methylase